MNNNWAIEGSSPLLSTLMGLLILWAVGSLMGKVVRWMVRADRMEEEVKAISAEAERTKVVLKKVLQGILELNNRVHASGGRVLSELRAI